MDEDGYFFMTDRLKRMINASGFKVWPAEMVLLMYRQPAVQEACIISTKDAYRGESVKAVVVLRPTHKATQAEDIVAWCRENMAADKVPRTLQFVDALRKSVSGKVMWRLLQEAEGLKNKRCRWSHARSTPRARQGYGCQGQGHSSSALPMMGAQDATYMLQQCVQPEMSCFNLLPRLAAQTREAAWPLVLEDGTVRSVVDHRPSVCRKEN